MKRERHRGRVTETNPLYTHHTNKAYNSENIEVLKEIERISVMKRKREKKI